MFKNMKIGLRLGITFGIISLLIVVLAIYTIGNLSNIGSDTMLLVNDRMPKAINTNKIIEEVNEISRAVRDMVILDDPAKISEEDARIDISRKNAGAIIEELQKSIASAEGKVKLETMIAARMTYLPVLQKLREYCKAGRDDLATGLLFGDFQNVQNDYIQKLSDLVDFQSHLMTSGGEQVLKQTQSVELMLIIVAVIVIVISVVVAFLVTRVITKPLGICIGIAKKVAVGRTDMEIQADSADETGQLMAAMKDMVESIRKLVNEVNQLSQAAVEGKLSARANASGHQGDFRKIVEGVNSTLGAAIEPVNEATAVLQEMSRGNLQISVTGNYKGDHATIKEALNSTIAAWQGYISDITAVLTEMSGGNLDVAISREYLGDFARIKDSLNLIIQSFNEVLNEFNNAAEQVASGSHNVSGSSQALSQASSEQAGTVEEITATMTQIATQTKQNAVNANQANEMALAVKNNAGSGNEQMREMLKAMSEINESSSNISKIIKVIDEIAFQTNILALNAAVEAARAGQYGKGFAVVAEEVRNLAARSANAAKETTALIEGSVRKVEAGTKIANETAVALDKIVDGVSKAANLIGEIATASNEQATGIAQVNMGIAQVSQVTQTNNATAEESAASSEELSSQAQLLKEMVGRFQIKGQTKVQAVGTGVKPASTAMSKTGKSLENQRGKKVKISLDDTEFVKY
jgi:methyl-accepting chemotaxis protein